MILQRRAQNYLPLPSSSTPSPLAMPFRPSFNRSNYCSVPKGYLPLGALLKAPNPTVPTTDSRSRLHGSKTPQLSTPNTRLGDSSTRPVLLPLLSAGPGTPFTCQKRRSRPWYSPTPDLLDHPNPNHHYYLMISFPNYLLNALAPSPPPPP